MIDQIMDGMMSWGWLIMLLVAILLVALIVLVIQAIIRMSQRPR